MLQREVLAWRHRREGGNRGIPADGSTACAMVGNNEWEIDDEEGRFDGEVEG